MSIDITSKLHKNIIYFMAFSLYVLYKFELFKSVFNVSIGLSSLLLFIVTIYITDFKTKEKKILVFSLLIAFIIFLFSRELNLIFLTIIIYAGKEIKIQSILKVLLLCYLLYFGIMLIQNIIGIYQSDYTYKFINGENVKVKTYGFGHPNQIANRFITFTALILYLGKEKIKTIHIVGLILAFTGVYFISLTRTALLIFVLLIIVHILVFRLNLTHIVSKISIYFFYLSIVFSIVGPLFYMLNNKILILLDGLLSGRLRLTAKFFEKYNISLFGQKLDYSGYDNVLDSVFPYMLLTYGFLFFIYYLLLSNKLFYLNKIKLKEIDTIYYVLFGIIGIVELTTINLSFNFTLLFFISMFNNESINLIKSKE